MYVLKGASASINKFKPILFIEVVDEYLNKNNSSAAALIRLVHSMGYNIVNAETFETVDPEKDFTNYRIDILCTPISKASWRISFIEYLIP